MKTKDIITGIVALIFVSGGLLYGLLTKDPDRTNWVLTTGRVYHISSTRSKWREVEYWIDSNRYVGHTGIGLSGKCVGDVYEILINPNDYGEICLLNERPIFFENEEVGETDGWINKDYKINVIKEYKNAYPKFMNYDEGYKVAYPEYYYNVGDKYYSRIQKIVLPRDSTLILKKGMRFKVCYWLQNPQRSVLDFKEKR